LSPLLSLPQPTAIATAVDVPSNQIETNPSWRFIFVTSLLFATRPAPRIVPA
jgi:hypothetical protein